MVIIVLLLPWAKPGVGRCQVIFQTISEAEREYEEK
jgi:hypothetical protein